MTPIRALAEDLRRFGLILLAAGIVGGILHGQVSTGSAVYTTFIGVALNVMGYWLHSWKED